MTSTSSKLFQPVQVGNLTLSHRVVLSALTRIRANAAHVHGDLAVEYYTQRGSVPGTLLVTEGAVVAPQAGGIPHVPYIFTEAQIQAWKKVTDAVHAKGSFIYIQLWALGRTADAGVLASEGPDFRVVAPSAVQLDDGNHVVPQPLTIPEIKDYVGWFRTAAENAVNKAGFDGVEFHMANGYLFDQFLQDVTNTRTDEYGGSVENRCRFPLEAVDAVTKAIGQERTAVKISPWSKFYDMRMKDPKPTFAYLVTRLRELYPQLSYINVTEPRVLGIDDIDPGTDSNDFLREIWQPRAYISGGGYTRESAIEAADKTGELIAFGRSFISNPDLPLRLEKDIPLTKGDRSTYYVPESAKGYIDYPFAEN